MQVLFHLGAHCTDGGLLIRSILRNRERLAQHGIGVPGPGRYRELFGDISTALRGDAASDETEAMLLEAIRDDDSAERLILSNENFLCRDRVAVDEGRLYPKAEKSAWLRRCLPSHEAEFALAMRNPATFLPDLLRRVHSDLEVRAARLAALRPEEMRWSDVVTGIADANPGARIILWCHEDTPFIWPEIMREMAGLDAMTQLDGAFDMLSQIITDEGLARLTQFLATRGVRNEAQRRRTIAAFMESHAIEEQIETEIDLPGWTEETVEALTALYDEDVERAAAIPGAVLISP